MRRIALLLLTAALLAPAQDSSAPERHRMVRDDIELRGIHDKDVLQTMRVTPRHLFMPPRARSQAYEDHPVPIGYGQTISQPYIVAYMTERLAVRKEHRVLEIGTGSGYQAAILAQLAGEVYTIEIVPELAKLATETLKNLDYRNVHVRLGDGYEGWPEKAPFDRILLTASPSEIPAKLIGQLKPGGRLLGPVGSSPLNQSIVIIDKATDGSTTTRSVLPVRFVPMVKPGMR
ncbi:MAG TPA: protein-L-isoaspartate(D-aspartate) O-methyltransferase [Bryobacteraceae bacterium]|nr:protein-L-isoaspartate(D-aspartate) O-methyltransferase [Bryobacteraceae bacterium]